MLLLMRLQDALIESTRPSRESTEAGGFVVMLTPTDPMVWLNYAVPVADTSLEGIDEMIAVFRNAGRVPRLEFFADLWPEVSTRLAEKGFYCEKRMPIMVLERANWKGLDHDHDVRPVDFATFTEMNRVLSDAFGGEPPEESDPYDDPMFQRIMKGEVLASVALVNGLVVGGGLGVGTADVREIAGIGTMALHRKKGIASAVIADLLDRFFGEEGEVAWLTPGDKGAQSVYARLGFKPIAEQVVYELS
jgi:GNAT superfamily N-acetyltransferase